MLTEKICTICALIVSMVCLLFCTYCYNKTKIAEARLMEIGCSLRNELKETEDKCKRYSDACIDILSNKVWE